jgi:hypothetical protein
MRAILPGTLLGIRDRARVKHWAKVAGLTAICAGRADEVV